MADRYAIATGNYSDPAIWDNGRGVPTASATVRPNGYTVTVDTDITAALLTNVALSPAVGGGSFVVNTNGRKITASVLNGAAICLSSNFAGTWTLIGNVTAGNTTCVSVSNASSGLTLVGNVVGSTNNGTTGISAVTITVVGNVIGGSLNGRGITATTVNLTGNATGGSAFSVVDAAAILCQNLTMNGIALGGVGGMAPAIYVTGSASGNITAMGGGNYYGVTGTGNGIVIKSAVFTSTGSLPFSPNVRFASNSQVTVIAADGSNLLMGTAGDDQADPSDVRNAVTYGNGLVGTCHVPPKASVTLNVPVDDGVGELLTPTVTVDEAAIAAAVAAALPALLSEPLAEAFLDEVQVSTHDTAVRLRGCVTTQILGSALSALP